MFIFYPPQNILIVLQPPIFIFEDPPVVFFFKPLLLYIFYYFDYILELLNDFYLFYLSLVFTSSIFSSLEVLIFFSKLSIWSFLYLIVFYFFPYFYFSYFVIFFISLHTTGFIFILVVSRKVVFKDNSFLLFAGFEVF